MTYRDSPMAEKVPEAHRQLVMRTRLQIGVRVLMGAKMTVGPFNARRDFARWLTRERSMWRSGYLRRCSRAA